MIPIIRSAIFRCAHALRVIAGVPDYDGYVAHMRSAHPRERVMTHTEFSATRMRERYDSPGSRCC